VKVLDFGLAKATEGPAASRNADSPTMTMSATRAGMILGTAGYMSPEQARGAAVDKRADIWAFGCVVYEMLTGRQAFHGETTSDILAAVLKEEPDWSRIPAKVQPLLRRCLVKDPKRRLRDIGDAMPLLDGVPEVAPTRQLWPWVTATATFAIAFCVAGVGWWRSNTTAPLRSPMRVSVDLAPAAAVDRFRSGNQIALSPDGTRIALVEFYTDGKRRLVTRRLDQNEFTPVSGADSSANMPFFSPDGNWIGFFAEGKLKKIPVHGGSPVTLCAAPITSAGASWGDDGDIIAALNPDEGLSRISSGGGLPTPLTALSQETKERAQSWPQVLPGSQAVLFTAVSADGNYEEATIDVFSFKTRERKTIHRGGFFGRYLPTSNGMGHLVYVRQNTLYAEPFDLRQLSVTGVARPVIEDLSNLRVSGSANFAFSKSGIFIYATLKGQPPRSIFWLDRAGKAQPLHLAPGFLPMSPRFSPDGKRLAFAMDNGQRVLDIWVKDLEHETTSRITSLPGRNSSPVWTPDGNHIVFVSSGSAASGIYSMRADGVGEPQRLTDGKVQQIPESFSPGKRLAFIQYNGRFEIWTAPVEGDLDHPRLGKPEPFLRTGFSAYHPSFSPDGRWLAYQSNETGTNEIYVRPFPGPGARQQVSTDGGENPLWSRNGRQLFFLTLDRRIMVAGFTAKASNFSVSKPEVWSQNRLFYVGGNYPYDAAPDGKRFAVVLSPFGTAEQEERPIDNVTVLLNFFDELFAGGVTILESDACQRERNDGTLAADRIGLPGSFAARSCRTRCVRAGSLPRRFRFAPSGGIAARESPGGVGVLGGGCCGAVDCRGGVVRGGTAAGTV
jgi:serine/threonine-protein kinase